MAKTFKEKTLEAEIKKFLVSEFSKYKNVYFHKNHGNEFSEVGRHDLTICKNGKFITVEVKGTSNNYGATPAQLNTKKLVEQAGGISLMAGDDFVDINDFKKLWERL